MNEASNDKGTFSSLSTGQKLSIKGQLFEVSSLSRFHLSITYTLVLTDIAWKEISNIRCRKSTAK